MSVIINNPDGGWLIGQGARHVLQTNLPAEVLPLLSKVDSACKDGRWAVGFVCYEAAAGLDKSLCTHAPAQPPLAWFALFDRMDAVGTLPQGSAAFQLDEWQPHISREQFDKDIAAIKDLIASGDTYQVNYTMRSGRVFRATAGPFFAGWPAAGAGPTPPTLTAGDSPSVRCRRNYSLTFRREGSCPGP